MSCHYSEPFILIAGESTVRVHIKRCISFRFLTAKKKIPSVSHHIKSNKISNELQQKGPMQFGYRTKSNTERFGEFDARTKSNYNEHKSSGHDSNIYGYFVPWSDRSFTHLENRYNMWNELTFCGTN